MNDKSELPSSFVRQAEEVHRKVLDLAAERDELRTRIRDVELAMSAMSTQNDDLRRYIERLRAERDAAYRVANSLITSCGEAKSIFLSALEKAEVLSKSFKAAEQPVMADDLADRLNKVVDGIKRINPEPSPSNPAKPVIRKLPPDFLRRVETEMDKTAPIAPK